MPSSTSSSEIKTPHTDRAGLQPPLLFGAAVFFALALLLSRGFLSPQEPPALPLPAPGAVRVLLGSGFPDPGVHQFSDGATIRSVIDLTDGAAIGPGAATAAGADAALVDGMALEIAGAGGMPGKIRQRWMPARQRMALGIPLHPDRMSVADWVSLPGIGESLARQIEQDRQNYGDFGRFEALERVKGVGPAKLKALRPFFVEKGKVSE